MTALRKVMLLIFCTLPLVAGSQTAVSAGAPTQYQLYFLSGQSNMEGFGYIAGLSPDWDGAVDRVMIFNGRTSADDEPGGGVGNWQKLQSGHGTGFTTDGKSSTLSDRFGPELAFGKRMTDLEPSARIAIIKYTRGGSALQDGASGFGTWEPDYENGRGINQYDHALATLREAMSKRDIDGDGKADVLIPAGIVWMQGEGDAYHSRESAEAYRENLKRMMDLLRAALRVDDLPVVIGKITDSGQDEDGAMMDYIEIVQQAQADFVVGDRCAAWVTETDDLAYSEDRWHYDTDGFLRLGTAFADAAHELQTRCVR